MCLKCGYLIPLLKHVIEASFSRCSWAYAFLYFIFGIIDFRISRIFVITLLQSPRVAIDRAIAENPLPGDRLRFFTFRSDGELVRRKIDLQVS